MRIDVVIRSLDEIEGPIERKLTDYVQQQTCRCTRALSHIPGLKSWLEQIIPT